MRHAKYIITWAMWVCATVGLFAQPASGKAFRIYTSSTSSARAAGAMPITEFHSAATMQGTGAYYPASSQQVMRSGSRYGGRGDDMRSTSAMPVSTYSFSFAAQDLAPQQIEQPREEAVVTLTRSMRRTNTETENENRSRNRGFGLSLFGMDGEGIERANQEQVTRWGADSRYTIQVAALHLENVGEAVAPYSASAGAPFKKPPLITNGNSGENPELPSGLPVGDMLLPMLLCALGYLLYKRLGKVSQRAGGAEYSD